jgi:hypothetical protein
MRVQEIWMPRVYFYFLQAIWERAWFKGIGSRPFLVVVSLHGEGIVNFKDST